MSMRRTQDRSAKGGTSSTAYRATSIMAVVLGVEGAMNRR